MRYVMWIAEFSESSNLWTHLAPLGIPRGTPVWVSWNSQKTPPLVERIFGLGGLFAGFTLKRAPPKWISGVCFADPWCDNTFLHLGFLHCTSASNCLNDNDGAPVTTDSYRWEAWPTKRPWPQIGWDYPLNLSISISGGKETNKDSPSNCEWSGKSSNFESGSRLAVRVVI